MEIQVQPRTYTDEELKVMQPLPLIYEETTYGINKYSTFSGN